MRARYPDAEGFVERDGVRVAQLTGGELLLLEGAGPDVLAQAIAAEIGRPVSYRPVEADGAARAAALLAELI
jgi:hypothetical protein